MPSVSDEELRKLREENDKLREDIAAANAKKSQSEDDRNREITAAQLMSENAKLSTQLARAEAVSKATSTNKSSDSVLKAAQEQLEQASKQAEQPAGLVDTNVKPPEEKAATGGNPPPPPDNNNKGKNESGGN